MGELTAPAENATPSGGAVAISPSPMGAGRMGNMLQGVRGLTAQPAVAKSLPAIGLIALLGIAALIWMAVSAGPDRTLFSGMADEDKATVVEALGTAGIAYSIDNGTGALSVSESDYYQAKMLLAAQGLPKSAPDGDAMITALPLGASRAVEGERLRGAHELDLARTIEQIDAVQSARVHLAVEAPSVFLRDRTKRAASVMLRLKSGRALSDAQVQAIVHLVAASVPGLAPDGVSIVDQNGRLLSSAGDDGIGAASDRQVAVQAKIEERYRQSLNALLTPIVGAGNFTAEVNAEVDFSESEATRENFPKEASTIRSEQGGWTSAGGQDSTAGIPGTLSNQAPTATEVAAAPGGTLAPPGAPGATAGAAQVAGGGKITENFNRNFAIGREVSVTRQPTGQIKRVSVAVALKNPEGKPLSKKQLASLEALVKGAVGYSQARGDVVALSASDFATIEDAGSSWWDASWVGMLTRNLTALGVVALLVFGVAKPLLRAKGGLLPRPALALAGVPAGGGARAGVAAAAPGHALPASTAAAVGNEIAQVMKEHGVPSDADITLSMIESAHSYEARAILVRNFVRQDPARAALVVRDLLRADRGEGVEKNG